MESSAIAVTHLTLDTPALAASFTRRCHDAGLPVSSEHAIRLTRALAISRPITRRRLYCTTRAVLVSDSGQIAVFDRVFASVFGVEHGPPADRQPSADEQTVPVGDDGPPVAGRDHPDDGLIERGAAGRRRLTDRSSSPTDLDEPELPLAVLAGAQERLHEKHFDSLDANELAALSRLMSRLELAPPLRRTRRARRDRRGDRIDLRRTLRESTRSDGDPIRLARRRRQRTRRRLVLLCDISGSMEPYARVYLQFLACAGRLGPDAEAFVFATRLTRLTRALQSRNPERAIAAAAAIAPDWSSGTRIGEALKTFNDRHGRRGLARGAVIVILSDGWERGDPALVGQEMERLARLAYRIVWVNPRAGAAGFEPRAGGMRAALPHCDALVSGHTLAALDEVVDAIAGERIMDRPQGEWPDLDRSVDSGTEEAWPSATPIAGSSVAMPSGYGPRRGATTPGWSIG